MEKIRAKMPPSQRAKQFAPFDALVGLRQALKEKEKIRVPRKEISEDMEEEINRELKSLEIGKIMAFINYLTQIMFSTIMVINIMMNVSRAKASADRVNKVFNTESSIVEADNAKDINEFDIEFKNVSFRYNKNSENVLENISFKAKEGETIGIIGSTGCGKSSLVSLIPRLYDVTEGEILIGGVNIKDIKLNTLRDKIGVVLQESILFSGTIFVISK